MSNNIFNEMDTAVQSLNVMKEHFPSTVESALQSLEGKLSENLSFERIYNFSVGSESIDVTTDCDGDIIGGIEEFSQEFQEFIQEIINNS